MNENECTTVRDDGVTQVVLCICGLTKAARPLLTQQKFGSLGIHKELGGSQGIQMYCKLKYIEDSLEQGDELQLTAKQANDIDRFHGY